MDRFNHNDAKSSFELHSVSKHLFPLIKTAITWIEQNDSLHQMIVFEVST